MQTVITCSNISIRFNGADVLNNINFLVPRGRHTVLKGESGSGKSTLMKLMLGFLKPTEGRITYNSKDYSDYTAFRQHTAWLPQDLDLGEGTVEQVLLKPFQFASNQAKIPGRETYISILAKFGLAEDNLGKQFRNLSTGQRQRIGLAICHLLDKPVMLLDEPTSALDKTSKKRAADILLAHTNKTVISTSHDPFWVKHADNIIELN